MHSDPGNYDFASELTTASKQGSIFLIVADME